jgi:hypothetical protein
MSVPRPATKRHYRALLMASLISGGNLLPLLPAFADLNSPTPGTEIQNQATAEFTDTADNSTGTALSDVVKVTVAEVAGISAAGSGITNPAYRTNVVYFDFKIKNEGNDPTQLFIPAKPSVVTVGGVAVPVANIGQLQVIEYNNVTATTSITANNLVNTSTGSATGDLTGLPNGGTGLPNGGTSLPNGGSVPVGGYITVRVPITIPANATTGDIISVTLGNTTGQPNTTGADNSNIPYVVGSNDLYTQDNAGTANGDFAGDPINGDTTGHRQEASVTQTTRVVDPTTVSIKGTAWDDANGSGTSAFATIKDGTETGANTSASAPVVINAILVDSTGKVLDSQPVNPTDGTYTLSTLGVQNGVYVLLSTTAGVKGNQAPTPSVPIGWAGTTPLTYADPATVFNIGIADITGKDFGIDRLPVTTAVNQPSQPNPPGTTQYQVPTLAGTDPEDGAIGTGQKFKIVTLPDPTTQGILYYDGVAVTAGQTISTYDPTKLKFDPVNGPVTMSFNYVAIDAAGKESATPAAATMSFSATNVTIAGKVWNDKNASATNNNPSTISPTADAEVGTDAVFGTTQTKVNAVLVDATTGKAILASVPVASDGSYSFADVPPGTDVKVLLSSTAVAVGEIPSATVPTGWIGTSPKTTALFNTGFIPVTSTTNDIDFGIRQKGKLVLLKLITKVNGQTTNPNDGTVLNTPATDTFNTGVGNWPANYLIGKTNGGYIKPGDTIEYTVYFLNNQGADASNVKMCDPIRGGQDYVPNTIQLQLGTGPIDSQTDGANATDYAHSYATGDTPDSCNAAAATSTGADNGGIAIGIPILDTALPNIVGATGVGTPSQSYGLFRFTTKVKP